MGSQCLLGFFPLRINTISRYGKKTLWVDTQLSELQIFEFNPRLDGVPHRRFDFHREPVCHVIEVRVLAYQQQQLQEFIASTEQLENRFKFVQAERHILGQPTAEIDIFALFLIFLLIFFEFGVADYLNLLVKDFQILIIV